MNHGTSPSTYPSLVMCKLLTCRCSIFRKRRSRYMSMGESNHLEKREFAYSVSKTCCCCEERLLSSVQLLERSISTEKRGILFIVPPQSNKITPSKSPSRVQGRSFWSITLPNVNILHRLLFTIWGNVWESKWQLNSMVVMIQCSWLWRFHFLRWRIFRLY